MVFIRSFVTVDESENKITDGKAVSKAGIELVT